jgi:DNA-binding GntR family transcriptional regulator
VASAGGQADSGDGAAKESLARQISRDLREQILAGRLSPGRRISQLSIAQQYGVSRLPAREALRDLASQGLVVLERSRSARIAALDGSDLREVCLMRELLEPLAVELAVPNVTDADLARAESLLADLENLSSSEDGWLRLDREFHTMWYERTEMPRLTGTIDQLWDVAQRYRALFSLTPDAGSVSDLEHRLLLEAVRRRSPRDASAILHMHLRHVRLTLSPSAAQEGRRRTRLGEQRGPGPHPDTEA